MTGCVQRKHGPRSFVRRSYFFDFPLSFIVQYKFDFLVWLKQKLKVYCCLQHFMQLAEFSSLIEMSFEIRLTKTSSLKPPRKPPAGLKYLVQAHRLGHDG